jgi:hypothetical protein
MLTQNRCYACQSCGAGQTLSGNTCITQVVERDCGCYAQWDRIGQKCETCRQGETSDNRDKRCETNRNYRASTNLQYRSEGCAARGQIMLTQNQCYRCQACGLG